MTEVYVDGSALGTKKRGRGSGWAYKLICDNRTTISSGGCIGGTNNRMEMMAVLKALRAVDDKKSKTIVYSDSELVVNILSAKWVAKNNLDLVDKLEREIEKFEDICFEWIKGHSGNPHNEEVDRTAREEAMRRDLRLH